jgi:anti-anti-sigma factor
VEVSGDLVVTNREAVGDAVGRLVAGGDSRVVVDATRLTHVDTGSFALLVTLGERCRAAGGELVVAGLPPAFGTLARELRLEEAVTLADSAERAVDRPDG